MDNQEKNIAKLAETYQQKLSAIQLPDMNVEDLLDLIDYYSRMGMDYEAEMYKRIATAKFPEDTSVLLMCAHWEADAGNWYLVQNVQGVLDTSKYDEALFEMERYVRQMDPEGALFTLERTLSPLLEDVDYDFLFDAAELFRDYGYMDHALRCLQRIPNTYPDYLQMLEIAAECFYYLGKYDESLEQLDKAIDQNAFDDYLWAQTALLNYKQEDYDKALDACEYSLAIVKDNPRAVHIKSLLTWQKYKDIDTSANPILNEEYIYQMEIGNLYYKQGEYRKAEQEYEAAGLHCPRGNRDRVQITFKTACARIMLRKTEEGVEALLSSLNQGVDLWPYALELLPLIIEIQDYKYVPKLLNPIIKFEGLNVSRAEVLLVFFFTCGTYSCPIEIWRQILSYEEQMSQRYCNIIRKVKEELQDKL